MNTPLRLSDFAHGGGCGCKLAPAVLHELLSGTQVASTFPNLLVGLETGDDAAVWRLDDNTCIVATTDFFTPVVDDPTDFGRIAATNAISDVYAMGGQPIMALALLGMPLGKIGHDIVRQVLEGGRSVCAAAGIPVAGGHSIDAPELIYGLVVIGIANPKDIKRNCDARSGDALILTKPLGVGVYSAAFKRNALSARGYADMIQTTTLLNKIGSTLAKDPAVHAMTDVTGFGLLGHALEMSRGSNRRLTVQLSRIPRLPDAERLIEEGYVTGASGRNWKSYGESVSSDELFRDADRHLLTDPQTSGGLLIACDPAKSSNLVKTLIDAGYHASAVIGSVEDGPPQVLVRS